MSGPDVVEVITGARLHFGLICGTAETGWQFGGLGLMVRDPGWHLQLRRQTPEPSEQNPSLQVTNPGLTNSVTVNDLQSGSPGMSRPGGTAAASMAIEDEAEIRERIDAVVSKVSRLFPCRRDESALSDPRMSSVAVSILRTSPLHAGFGAGTQLTLSIAEGLRVLSGYGRSSEVLELAEQLGRATRSAVGTEGFSAGGLIVDYGRPASTTQRRRTERYSVPDNWRFVLVRPVDESGLSGESEKQFFDKCRTMSQQQVGKLSEIIEDGIIAAVHRRDFGVFARLLGEYGREAGRFYAAEQGDVFSCPTMSRLASWLESQHVYGAAQSSWGPGICIPADSPQMARMIAELIADREATDEQVPYQLMITDALNHGATIRTALPDGHDRGSHHRWC